MPAVLTLAFDPVLRLSDTASVRVETIGLAIVLLAGLLVAARIAKLTPAAPNGDAVAALRLDDLVFIAVGAVPGAIVGGRLGYVLDHLDFYRTNSSAILDPAQGGLTLTLAVPLGILTGALIARLLGAPVGRWMHVAALPLLFVLGAGKLVGVLGATGQGAATSSGWATAYAGPGPWGSLGADIPAHPSQVYEALAIAVAIAVLAALSRTGLIARRDGAALYLAVALWGVARFLVGFTWRDETVLGPLRMDQLLVVAVIGLAALGLSLRRRVPARAVDRRFDAEARPV